MKFGKELKAQMVPEWQEAYMDYNSLKSHLEEIQRFRLKNKPPGGLKRKLSLYRAFSGLTHSPPTSPDIENQAISVNAVSRNGSLSFETTFLKSSDEGAEYELVYFRRLDDELNKVNKFYERKVDEVMKEADLLNKQMVALIAFRIKVYQNILDSDDVAASTAPLHVLERVTINNTAETPWSTIKGLLGVNQTNELEFTKENLRKVEDQLKRAFIGFHHKLRLLKSFSFLNTLAFSKIMKKYDKIASRNASKAYMISVDDSSLGSSDEVNKLMERVEATFIKHFANSNRTKGMTILRPKAKRERHRTTFSMGFFSGCSVALIIALVVIIHARNIMDKPGKQIYMSTMFPLYSLFGFLVLHMIMYAVNIFYWRKYRVNYAFIFGFKQGTELGYRQILLLSFSIAVLALISVLANLDMEMDPKTLDYKMFTELLPLNLLILLLVILLLPFNVLYRSSRFFFIMCIFHCIAAPLYKVTLPDFFLADQLTSQVQAFRSLEFYVCYYGWGDYKVRENSCKTSDVFNTFYFIVAVVPYWARLLQCLRRLVEERDPMQGYNGLKYLLTVVAVCLRTAYSLNKLGTWRILAWVFSIIAVMVGTYWDLVVDWGLLQRGSKNRWLRDKLLVPHKSVYFIAMGLNVVLRFAWLQTVTGLKIFSLHRETTVALVACLEIIRRGIWNFFRLENEHLNNVGKYRAFKSVPLPFNYDEDDDDKDD